MTIFYIFLLLVLNYTTYRIVKKLKRGSFQIAFILILIIIAKIASEMKKDVEFTVIDLLKFSVAIPFFSFFFMYISNKVKTEKPNREIKNLELKFSNYLTTNDYALHITIVITLYQLLLVFSENI